MAGGVEVGEIVGGTVVGPEEGVREVAVGSAETDDLRAEDAFGGGVVIAGGLEIEEGIVADSPDGGMFAGVGGGGDESRAGDGDAIGGFGEGGEVGATGVEIGEGVAGGGRTLPEQCVGGGTAIADDNISGEGVGFGNGVADGGEWVECGGALPIAGLLRAGERGGADLLGGGKSVDGGGGSAGGVEVLIAGGGGVPEERVAGAGGRRVLTGAGLDAVVGDSGGGSRAGIERVTGGDKGGGREIRHGVGGERGGGEAEGCEGETRAEEDGVIHIKSLPGKWSSGSGNEVVLPVGGQGSRPHLTSAVYVVMTNACARIVLRTMKGGSCVRLPILTISSALNRLGGVWGPVGPPKSVKKHF